MSHIKHQHSIIFLLVLLPCLTPARQQVQQKESAATRPVILSIALSPNDTLYRLPRGYIAKLSEKVWLDSCALLTRSTDYVIDYTTGDLLVFSKTLRSTFSDSAQHRLVIEFLPLPFEFKRQYSLRELVVRTDSLGRKDISVAQSAFRFAPEEFFGKGFQKSGTLVRGFTIGSNQDLSLTSGFRMQLNGALSKEIMVTAALTDENSPIQPEGTTQSLREVDKVFVNLKTHNFDATLGDFNLDLGQKEGGEFGRLFRKLQGASGSAVFDNFAAENLSANGSFTAATARGKYATNNFQGIDGNQGPYRLTGQNGEQQIFVLAGTERIYVDGQLMKRGDLNDYTIDYGNGDVTFTSHKLITNASRMSFDFEYSDQQYTRNLIAMTTGGSAMNGKLNFTAVLAQEADDPESPIDFNLDNASRTILSKSGSDQLRASLPGVRYIGIDSAGNPKGQYILKDTVINAKTYHILIYAPGEPGALYSAVFSSVSAMPSDSAGYARIAGGQYQFAGIGLGSYLPVQLLPMPQLHQSFDLNGSLQIIPELKLSGEYATTRFEHNRLSDSSEPNNTGSAMKFSLQFNPKRLLLMGRDLGALEVRISERYVDHAFVPLDRFNDVEFNRTWNLSNTGNANEEIREASVIYTPVPVLLVAGGYGLLNRPGETRSLRTHAEIGIKDSLLPSTGYSIENIANDDYAGQQNSSWLRQSAEIGYRFGNVVPSIGFHGENRTLYGLSQDSLLQGAFRILEIAPRLGVSVFGPISASVGFQARTEDSSVAGSMQRASKSLTQQYSLQLSEWRSLSSSLALNIRSVSFTDEFKNRGNSDGDFVLVRSQTRYAPLQRALEADAFYEFASQRSARLERVYLRVPKGTGNYIYKGDLNGNGIADDNEFELTKFDGDYVVIYVPSEKLYPVVNLKSSFRFRIQPERILRSASTFWEEIFKAVSTETNLRVEEQSNDADPQHIYLFDFRYFQNDKTSISGSSQVQQDLFVFESNPDLSFRFRYNQRDGFVQLVSANERSLLREQSVRIRSQLAREIGNQTDFTNRIDRVSANVPTSRERNLISNGLITDFSYRPEIQWEIGFNFSVSRSVDIFNRGNTTADINEQGIRITYGLLGAGQLRSEFSREEVALSNYRPDPIRGIPFELTNGSGVGKNYLWQLDFDYRINQNVQVSIQYSGRSEGGKPPVHSARAEARAFF